MRSLRSSLPLVLFAVGLPNSALAAWPEDVSPSSMAVQDGEVMLDSKLLAPHYEQLMAEVGTMVANPAILPAETLGQNGWDYAFTMQFVFNEAHDRGNELSPWNQAHQKEDQLPYQWIPTFSARKGLPLSTEVGMNAGWVGMSNQGVFGGYGRVALLEGYKPWPDLSLQLGYSGLVGNNELEVGTLDMGVTLGSTYYTGALPGVHMAAVSPWASFSMLRVSAASKLDDDTQTSIGAQDFVGKGRATDGALSPIAIPQVALGWQIVSQNIHARVGLSWAPQTIPTLNTGMGFTF